MFQWISIQIGDVDHVEVHKRTRGQRSNLIVFEVQNVEGESNGRLRRFRLQGRRLRWRLWLASGVRFINGEFPAAGSTSFDNWWWGRVDGLDDMLNEIVGYVKDSKLFERSNGNVRDFGENIVGK